ncbi:unnamed protein product [Macrosiphum euphorbiae]|uniref:Uncharacterized protein n=1 Tax=Macrosiphum euphorbiae TaxID=13131 RepID=A0AAV0VWF5_9HEMI|nr:unnamed protein product [Macrosiphum euphorbiae]
MDRPTHRLYRSDAEIMRLELLGETAAPVYRQIWLPNYADHAFRSAMAIVDAAPVQPATGTVSGQRHRRSVCGPNAIVNTGIPAETRGLLSPGWTRGGGGFSPGTLSCRRNWNREQLAASAAPTERGGEPRAGSQGSSSHVLAGQSNLSTACFVSSRSWLAYVGRYIDQFKIM